MKEKMCPVKQVIGNRIILGDPVEMLKAPYLKKERLSGPALGAWPLLLVPIAKLLGVLGLGAVGVYLAGYFGKKAVGETKPLLDALVPLGIAGLGIYTFTQLKPWLEPIEDDPEFKKTPDPKAAYERALSRYKILRLGVVGAIAGFGIWGISRLAEAAEGVKTVSPLEAGILIEPLYPGELESIKLSEKNPWTENRSFLSSSFIGNSLSFFSLGITDYLGITPVYPFATFRVRNLNPKGKINLHLDAEFGLVNFDWTTTPPTLRHLRRNVSWTQDTMLGPDEQKEFRVERSLALGKEDVGTWVLNVKAYESSLHNKVIDSMQIAFVVES